MKHVSYLLLMEKKTKKTAYKMYKTYKAYFTMHREIAK